MSVGEKPVLRAVLTADGEKCAFEYSLASDDVHGELSDHNVLLKSLRKLRDESGKAMTELVEREKAQKGEFIGTDSEQFYYTPICTVSRKFYLFMYLLFICLLLAEKNVEEDFDDDSDDDESSTLNCEKEEPNCKKPRT
jgi:hypothetical protein